MSKLKIVETFAVVTPESAEHGDFSETGWTDEKGRTFETVLDAVNYLIERGAAFQPSSTNFHPGIWYSAEPEQDLHDGSDTTASFHLKGFTKEQELELYNRLIGVD